MKTKVIKPVSMSVRVSKPAIKTYTKVHRDRKNQYVRKPKYPRKWVL